jgi:hypothetical protein
MIVNPRTQLKQLADDCTVAVLQDGTVCGSGFFVAPRTVLTCAHVVGRDRVADHDVTIEWRGTKYQGVADARPEHQGSENLWAMPDLCVVSLGVEPPNQPWVVLGELGRPDNETVYLAGHSNIWNPAVGRHSEDGVRLGGMVEVGGGQAWKVAGGEIPHGLSGGPVLDPARGIVCAVTKSQRLENSNLGGLVIPAELIRTFFADVWERNQEEGTGNSRWQELRNAVGDHTNPAGSGLTFGERDLLARAAELLQLTRKDFTELWGLVPGSPVPGPARPFRTLDDLIDGLADSMREGLDPVTRLFVCLAYSIPVYVVRRPELLAHRDELPGCRDELLGYAETRAIRDRHRAEFYEYCARMSVREVAPAQKKPVVVVRLVPDPPGPAKMVTLEAWSYADRDAIPVRIECDPGPYDTGRVRIRKLRKSIIDLLDTAISALAPGADPVIEFALPDDLIDLAVEDWEWESEVPLREMFPVVVRFAERSNGKKSNLYAWRRRAPAFRTEAVPEEGTMPWAAVWITCQSRYDARQLNTVLRNVKAPMMAMTGWPGPAHAKVAVTVAKLVGASVILWQRDACNGVGCGAMDGNGQCRGMMFRELVGTYLSGELLYDLPEKVFDVRLNSLVPGAVILWDDPGRSAWDGGPPMSLPVGK